VDDESGAEPSRWTAGGVPARVVTGGVATMSTVQFTRTPRLSGPRTPGGEVHLEAPPEVPRMVPAGILMVGYPFHCRVASKIMMCRRVVCTIQGRTRS